MDLKEFIVETISGIAEATFELQLNYEVQGMIINPPVSLQERDLYEEGSAAHTYRRVEVVDFDVAVTASSETGGGGKAGLKVLSIEAGVDGNHARRSEEVSRVRFSIPISLPRSSAESRNRVTRDEQESKSQEAMANYRPPSVV